VIGRNPVWEALQAGLPIQAAYVAEGTERDDRLRDIFKFTAAHSIALLEVSRQELDRWTGGANHQGVAVKLPSYDYADPIDLLELAVAETSIVVVCDQITDPHNLGAIVRSAAGFGAVGVVIPERRSAQVTAAVWKASAGSLAFLPVARVGNLTQYLKQANQIGLTTVGLAGEAELTVDRLAVDSPLPLLLVVGSEGDGLSRLVRQHCDWLVKVPITGVESLNASVATGIALYEFRHHQPTNQPFND
jgi:23S rRNA (guanosine2251-2'-O)-methyltransferase